MSELKAKKELVINANPRIRSYTYHCFFHAIVSGEDKVSKTPAKVSVKDFMNYKWEEQADQLSHTKEGNTITYTANEWNLAMNHCFYRECQEKDEIEIQIEKQMYANAWGAINVFITNEEQTDMLNDDQYRYRLGNFCKEGVYLRINNKDIVSLARREETPFTLIIRKDGKQYTSIYKRNEEERVLNTWVDSSEAGKKRIGFEVKLNNNDFYEWYYAHYIQIYGDLDSNSIRIDYLVNPLKNWYTYESNYFIQYRTINREMIPAFGMNTLEYVKACINAEQYVEMWLNENFMDQIEGEGITPHIHQNLVYGYDDEKRILKVLRTKLGIPTLVTMRYEDFESDMNYCDRYKLIVPTSYSPEYSVYEITPKYLVYILKAYYDSTDMSMGLEHCALYGSKQWGIQMLRKLMTPKGLEVMLNDIRVSHLLYERATCMKERIEYLTARKIITEEEKKQVDPEINEAIRITSVIRNLVLKQRFVENMAYASRVKERLEELYRLEKNYLPKLIHILEEKIVH